MQAHKDCDCLRCRQTTFFLAHNGPKGYTGPEYLIPKDKYEIRVSFLKPDLDKLWHGEFYD